MNSVAGNKERLAVSTRGKKYGVSCDRYNASPDPRRRGPSFSRYRAAQQGGSEISSRCRGAAAGCACVEAGLPRGLPHTRLALGIFSALSCLPFPTPLTFAAFPHFEAELCGTRGFSMNSLPLLGIISLEPA